MQKWLKAVEDSESHSFKEINNIAELLESENHVLKCQNIFLIDNGAII